MRRSILLLLFLFLSANCFALTGNDLLILLEHPEQDKRIRARIYIDSAMDSIYFHKAVIDPENSLNKNICIPENVTLGQGNDVITKSLKDNPGPRHHSAYSLIYLELFKQWPCLDK